MSTSGWSLPARAKTRGLGLPPALSQLAPSLRARWGEVFFFKGLPKLGPVQPKGLSLNIG